jgi:hypothetical protein
MRYLLMFAGLAGLALGGLMLAMGGELARQAGQLLFLSGAVWTAAGFATVDIVDAIGKKRASAANQGAEADPRPPLPSGAS